MNILVAKIKKDLLKNVDAKAKESFPRFFKSEVLFYGVRAPIVRKIAKEHFKELKLLKKEEIFSLCEDLFCSKLCEEAWVAANWLDWISSSFIPEDLEIFERWIILYIDDWAKCDTLCNHALGSFFSRYPFLVESLKKWAQSSNPFVRRAAAVSLIIPAKRGFFLEEVFEISDILLLDQHDLVQKGYGWLLKEASRKHPNEVFEYLMCKKNVMPRTSFRYALEKMPQNLRIKAMEKN